MLVNDASLGDIFTGYKAAFQNAFDGEPTAYKEVATVVTSGTGKEVYPWLAQLPQMREWIGDRHIHNLQSHGYTIENRKFELTLTVPVTTIEDDSYRVFAPVAAQIGADAARHPDELVFSLLDAGFTKTCYDGKPFFAEDHVGYDRDGGEVAVTNMATGSGHPWFLLDCSRPVKPLIYQERVKPTLTTLNKPTDENVFMRDEILYGVRQRSNAGFGLWQFAFGSKAALDATTYTAARLAMFRVRGQAGRPLGIRPTHLVVPPEMEEEARSLLEATNNDAGASNVWKGSTKLIVTAWLAGAA